MSACTCGHTGVCTACVLHELTPRPCLLCGTPTTGSVGAAGLRWKSVCQPCKDREDAALDASLKGLARALDVISKEIE